MICVTHNKTDKSKNRTIAVCDGCKAECQESAQSDAGLNATKAADAAAHAVGWIDRIIDDPPSRRRGPSQTVQLICLACQVKGAVEPS